MTNISWEKDFDQVLRKARAENKTVLLDFFNPQWIGCQQMGAVTYPDKRVVEFIEKHLIPIQVMFDAQPLAARFNVQWTPTVITLDEEGKEHHRTIGFLAPEEFIPSLMLGVAKCDFDREKFSQAISMLDGIVKDYPKSDAAPEAVYLRGVASYKSTHQADALKDAYKRLSAEYPSSEWAKRAKPYSLL